MHISNFNIPQLRHTDSDQFFLIAGPCAIESEDIAFEVAQTVKALCEKFKIPYIFKGSYRKANRSRIDSFSGIGDEEALAILRKVRDTEHIPTTTDIHADEEAALAAQSVDILQIPAFLCRQTSLLIAAANTGKVVNIKKGQFASSETMLHAVQKVRDSGNNNIMLTERGNTFGYGDLVVDYRNIPEMRAFQVPVIMDCTHSLQQPNSKSGVTGGKPALIETIARAAIAVGADGIFIETHPDPIKAKSDGANMLPLHKLPELLEKLCALRHTIQKFR